jgi:hypothetical protein
MASCANPFGVKTSIANRMHQKKKHGEDCKKVRDVWLPLSITPY